MKAYITLKYFRSTCMPSLDMKTACSWINLEPEKIYERGVGFQSVVENIDHIEKEIDAIFNRIEPLKVDLARIMGIYNTELSIAIYSEGNPNRIHIKHDVLRKLANWGGAVNIDIYHDESDSK